MATVTHLYCTHCRPYLAGAPADRCVRCLEFAATAAAYQQADDRAAVAAAAKAEAEAARQAARQAEIARQDREFPFVVTAVTLPGQGFHLVGRYRTMAEAREAAVATHDGRPWLRNQDVIIETAAGRRICFAGPAR